MSLQLDLFQERGPGSPAAGVLGAPPELVEQPGLRLRLWSRWLPEPDAIAELLRQEVPWKQELITLWGRTHPLPRLTCWMGDPGCAYTYSGLRNRIEAWTPAVQRLKARVEAELGVRFNSLLLNRYRDGRDRLHWHADDEPELDPRAPIASLSLGSARSFRLRPRHAPEGGRAPLAFELGLGDLLVMDPPTQEHWLHQVPQRLRLNDERINLTFRVIRPEAIRPYGSADR
jgi:alkylated DNA repair dioxygenase AlkB